MKKFDSDKIKKNLKKSQNINEMLMFMEIFYKGPNPDMFNKVLHKDVVNLQDIEMVRNYLISLVGKMDFSLALKKVKVKKN